MLQGNRQSVICAYVFDELPEIYKKVCDNKPNAVENGEVKKKGEKPLVKCDQCRFKSNMMQMKMHIRNVHEIKQRKASKRLPVFTPIAKPSKKSKSCFDPKFDININTEGINDESIFLVSDESRESDANLEENVMLTGIFSCDKNNSV